MTGAEAEALFVEMWKNKGITPTPATRGQNMFAHIDFFVGGVGYDVKSEKVLNRSDPSNKVIWIEKKGVTGLAGWLHGQADIISFYVDGEFWHVDRKTLEKFVQAEITNEKVFKVQKYKKWYTRAGQKDQIAYFYARDIEPLVIKKDKI